MAHISPEDFRYEWNQLSEAMVPISVESTNLMNECVVWGFAKNSFLILLTGFVLFWVMRVPGYDTRSMNWRSAWQVFLMITLVYSMLELLKVIVTPNVYLLDKLMG